MDALTVIILAAGKGTRMKSNLPKVCHCLEGKPLISWVVATAKSLKPKQIIIVVSSENQIVIANMLNDDSLIYVIQEPQLGTAHAVLSAKSHFSDKVLILLGDVPLLKIATLNELITSASDKEIKILAFDCVEENQYGRLLINEDNLVEKIVEYKEATAAEKSVTLCNSGLMFLAGKETLALLSAIDNNNSKAEYYLTDVVTLANLHTIKVSYHVADMNECTGINTQADLQFAASLL